MIETARYDKLKLIKNKRSVQEIEDEIYLQFHIPFSSLRDYLIGK